MPYGRIRGRRPFERASKISHTEIINNPLVERFIRECSLPEPPLAKSLQELLTEIPGANGDITTVIAIDGGLNETFVREEFPSASVAFITLGPLMLKLEDLRELEQETFIGPEDMQRLKQIQRYNLVLPTRAVHIRGCATFSQGVRRSVQDFLLQGDGDLMKALSWLLFREWLPERDRQYWEIPRCPNSECPRTEIRFRSGDPVERICPECRQPIYLADGLRLYERIDEELGAGGILGYLLTALEQIVLVHLIRSVWEMKATVLKEILFVKDGPLAFFGVTAPLYKPMRELMGLLATAKETPLINLVGLEKSGPFVEHAALIEQNIPTGKILMLGSDYIYGHIVPGDPHFKQFGKNTYYGAKGIFKGAASDTYVVTVPTGSYKKEPTLQDMLNGPEVLATTSMLRCSMYDNALLPVVLANKLVSLADVPSADILKKFAKDRISASSS